jgi:hypothetical protein
MKVFIKSCSDPLLWYADHVNEIRDVMFHEPEHKMYWGVDNGGYTNFIHEHDAFVVEE